MLFPFIGNLLSERWARTHGLRFSETLAAMVLIGAI